MKNNPQALKLLASKLGNTPEWTGSNGVFISRFSAYKGVKIFAGYVKQLRDTNTDKHIPDKLNHRAYDYLDYLQAKPDEFKKEYEQYYKHTVPRIREMIRLGKMTMNSILVFANIFNDLGIGLNPNTIVADYQTAISGCINLKSKEGQTTDNSTEQNYQMMILSDREKKDIVEKCRQKGVLISENDLDYLYYGESDGGLYYGNGNPVTQAALGIAIAETLQYQVAKGDAEKLKLPDAEIEAIIEMCSKQGLQMNKEDLEDMYMDKDGNVYDKEGTMIKDTVLITAITQTATYAEKYAKMADRRAKTLIQEQAEPSQESVAPEEMLAPVSIPKETSRMGEIPEITPEDTGSVGASEIPETPTVSTSDRTPSRISLRGGLHLISPLNEEDRQPSRLGTILGDRKPNKLDNILNSKKGSKLGRILSNRDGTRKRGKRSKQSQGQDGQDQGGQEQGQEQAQDQQSQESKAKGPSRTTEGGNVQPPQEEKSGLKKGVAIFTGVAGAGCVCEAVYGATFLFHLPLIDNHYFISSILKILFP